MSSLPRALRNAVETLVQQQQARPKYSFLRTMFKDLQAKAREEGLAEGREEGRNEGREEGLAAVRAVLATTLRTRGISLGSADEARIAACRDLAVLVSWLTRASAASTASDVFHEG